MAGSSPSFRGTADFDICLRSVGEQVLRRIPEPILEAYIPYHILDLRYGKPQENAIRLGFRSLPRAKSPGGSIYYSRHRPTLTVDGQEKVIGFSDHAVQRICERTVYDWRTYAGAGDAFAFLHCCVYFEDCTAGAGQPCFALYNRTPDGFFAQCYAQMILGQLEPGKRYYYRVGYCPAVIRGDYLVANTLLIPGMAGTPEERVLRTSGLPAEQKRRMAEQVEKLTYRALLENLDFTLLRWFHANGVPQVVTLDRQVFRYD